MLNTVKNTDFNPFLFFEMDFSPEIFRKYYSSGITSPGIYAIPEDTVNPSSQEEDNFELPTDSVNSAESDEDSETTQADENKDNLDDKLSSMAPTPQMKMTPEETERYIKEIEPIKKIFLLQKLNSLALVLKNSYSIDSDLDIILKFGPNLSYKTIYGLTVNVLNALKEESAKQESKQQEQSGVSLQQNEKEIV